MSPVIKVYIFVPIPVMVTEKPFMKPDFEWQNKKPVPQRLTLLLYRWMSRQPRSRWN